MTQIIFYIVLRYILQKITNFTAKIKKKIQISRKLNTSSNLKN